MAPTGNARRGACEFAKKEEILTGERESFYGSLAGGRSRRACKSGRAIAKLWPFDRNLVSTVHSESSAPSSASQSISVHHCSQRVTRCTHHRSIPPVRNRKLARAHSTQVVTGQIHCPCIPGVLSTHQAHLPLSLSIRSIRRTANCGHMYAIKSILLVADSSSSPHRNRFEAAAPAVVGAAVEWGH